MNKMKSRGIRNFIIFMNIHRISNAIFVQFSRIIINCNENEETLKKKDVQWVLGE